MHELSSNPVDRDGARLNSKGITLRALVTAGPTEEPIDAVRFIGNRSSGRMGCAITRALIARGVEVTLLAGPIRVALPEEKGLRVKSFRTANDLELLMREELPHAHLVVMAAAVADYRCSAIEPGKLRRTSAGLTLELEAVPDLLASTRNSRREGARVIGFALEPRERLEVSAREKLLRKDLFAILANPLETMDSPDIEATLYLRDGEVCLTAQKCSKEECAVWFVEHVLRGLVGSARAD